MIQITGDYAEADAILAYVCRAIPHKGVFYDGLGRVLEIKPGDVLLMLGPAGYALYRTAKPEQAQQGGEGE